MTTQPSQKWIFAAALACLWASSEIIIGSFLHNLKVPMRGTILASVAVIIMSAIGFRYRLKGIYWRAALLTAAMKTLSPSAVLLGPMVAISFQGLFMEAVIALGGTRRFFFILGGALSISWNFLHLILGYWLYYGNDAIALGEQLVAYARRETGWNFISGKALILAFGSLYFTAGAIAAIIGTSIKKPDPESTIIIPRHDKHSTVHQRKKGPQFTDHSVFWLILLLILLSSTLFALGFLPLSVSLFAWLSVISILILRYRFAYRRLAKPGFWILFLIITLLSSLLLGKDTADGLIIGLRMNMRAILFVLTLSALSVELRNDRLATRFRHRNKGFLTVLETCFDTLPMVISLLPPVKQVFRSPKSSLSLFINTMSVWVDSIHFRQLPPCKALVISGPRGSGKSSLLKNKVIPELIDRQIAFSGMVMEYTLKGDQHIGYSISLIPGNEQIALAGPDIENASYEIGKYRFSRTAFQLGEKHISSHIQQSSVLILDESGWLETYGLGWYNSLKEIRLSGKPIIVVLRPDLKDDFIKFWNFTETGVLQPSSSHEEVSSAFASFIGQ